MWFKLCNSKKEQTKSDKQLLFEIKKKIFVIVNNSLFKVNIQQIFDYIDYCELDFLNNGFVARNKDNSVVVNVNFSDNCVYFSIQNFSDKEFEFGIYHIDSFGNSYVKHVKKNEEVFENVYKGKKNNIYNLYHVKKEINFSRFDFYGVEQFSVEEVSVDDYYKNKISGERVLTSPNYFENYTEKNYYFRDDSGYIIKKYIKQYVVNTEEIKDETFYLISEEIASKSNKIPKGGYYSGISSEMYKKYKLGECDFEDCRKTRVKNRISVTYF